jgi:uncharacterized protein
MEIEFDPEKNEKNSVDRELPFQKAADFDWESAVYYEDDRKDYPEQRIIALGFIGLRLYVICFTPIESGVRIISFRKANKREVTYYEQEILDR